MNIKNNLTLYQELISCRHELYLWSYSPELELLHTNCPEERTNGDSVFLFNQAESLLNYASDGHYPFVMDSFPNILWIADFEWEQNELKKIHIIGPAFSGRNSYHKLTEKLKQRNLSIQAKLKVLKRLDEIPIIPIDLLFEYAIMLHFCITGEKISSQDFHYPSLVEEGSTENILNDTDEYCGIWESEQMLFNLIREGNIDYKEALKQTSFLSGGIKFEMGDSMRQAQNKLLVFLTMCSRTAIEGGVSPSISYTLFDYYAQKNEDAKTISEIPFLYYTILKDYIQRIQQAKRNATISKTVQSCCDYINIHITEKISINFIAKRAGYTKYYFSRKFKQEKGCSINEYINQVKIRHAKLLLSSTKMSIQEISYELSYSSCNYFSNTFQKITGYSPGAFRKKNLKV